MFVSIYPLGIKLREYWVTSLEVIMPKYLSLVIGRLKVSRMSKYEIPCKQNV